MFNCSNSIEINEYLANQGIRKKLRYRMHRIRENVKEKKFSFIFTDPLNILLFILLIMRFIILRLMPQFSKVYFIRKDFKDKIIAISETAYEFKIFNKYSEELNEFILNRCKESGNLLFNVYSEVITSRFNKGMTACAILQKRKIVSLFFTSTQDCTVEQVNYTYRPQNNEIAIIDIYTLADYRKKGLYSLLLQHVISYYRKSGMSIFVMWIMKHNRATIQAQLKLGFTDIFQTVSLFSWLGFEKNSVNISLQPLKGL